MTQMQIDMLPPDQRQTVMAIVSIVFGLNQGRSDRTREICRDKAQGVSEARGLRVLYRSRRLPPVSDLKKASVILYTCNQVYGDASLLASSTGPQADLEDEIVLFHSSQAGKGYTPRLTVAI